jgi:uncharacterized integral membrane protein (TIGR00698 family)
MSPANRAWVLLILLMSACLLPMVTAPMALAAGILFGLLIKHPCPRRTNRAGKWLLQLSVVGLGFGLGIGAVLEAGRSGIVFALAGIVFTLCLGRWLGRRFGVPGPIASLVSVGTAICGGSAIAALAPVIEADDEEIAVSLATVFTLNAVALFVFPHVGHWAGLDQQQFGLWAALAIHDTSSVVGAGAVYGATALAVATTVKLARAAWIAPVVLVEGWLRGSRSRPKLPWFILGFLCAATLRSLVPQGEPVWDSATWIAKRLLVMTLFLIGSGLTPQLLRRVGMRPMFLGVTLWLVVATTSMMLIRARIIG